MSSPVPDVAAGLRAVCVPLPPGAPIDPVSVAGSSGVLFDAPWLTLAGYGPALDIPLPGGLADGPSVAAAVRRLAGVPCDDRARQPGSGVVAHAALPFGRSAPGRLLVPRLTYGRDAEGREWATLVGRPGPDGDAEADPERLRAELAARRTDLPAPGPDADAPGAAPSRAGSSPADYTAAVAAAVRAIASTTLRKVVLSRWMSLTFAAPPDPATVVRRLQAQEPACTAFSHPVDGGRFLGASPELLVSRRGPLVRSHPLAGTVGLTGDDTRDAEALGGLEASAKDQGEHRLVVEEVAEALGRRCSVVDVPRTPSLVRLHSVAHLATSIDGTLQATGGTLPSVLELLADLHPTAAVGGVPRAEALALIAELEPVGRGHWAGPVGWVDGQGDGDFMVGIRSTTLRHCTATVRAGCGIVAASDPATELAEAGLKLAPVLEALSPGLVSLLGPDLTP